MRACAVFLAVILHAAAQTSLFPMGDLWAYNDKNTDLSKVTPAWHSYEYDDTSWVLGYGGFGNGGAVVQTSLTAGSSTSRIVTYYFRKVPWLPCSTASICLASFLLLLECIAVFVSIYCGVSPASACCGILSRQNLPWQEQTISTDLSLRQTLRKVARWKLIGSSF